MVEGETSDRAGDVETAQFFLAKVLSRLGFTHSALGLFDQLSLPHEQDAELSAYALTIAFARAARGANALTSVRARR